LDELPAYLVTERSSEIDLSDEEMLAIPQLLGCTRWGEINALLAGGVLSAWEAAPTISAPAPAPAPESTPAPAVIPTSTPARARWAGVWSTLARWPARAGLAALALLIVMGLAFQLRPRAVPTPDQPG